jgi:DNA-binding protein HU-beta
MTKELLVNKMARDAKITKRAAEIALNSFIMGVRGALKRGERVSLVGFGTFLVGRRAARNGRDPRTGKPIKIGAMRVPRFRPGQALRDAVR